MLFSNFFAPTSKDVPANAEIASHVLMLRSGMISQTASGIYCWLPLAVRVMEKIEKIICEEQDRIGAQKVYFTTVQPVSLWIESGRYDSYGKEMLRLKDRKDNDFLYSPTNEEQATDVFRKYVKSYRGLPVMFYQIHWKFRDEIRPRFGVMRGREFLMKDGYSFDIDFAGAKKTYDAVFRSYVRTFRRLGLTPIPVQADSGAMGGNMSHEFQILAATGESTLYYDKKLLTTSDDELMTIFAATDEKFDHKTCQVSEKDLMSSKGIEVGHIFYFGTKYSKSMGAFVLNKNGEKIYPEMGSYGIGVSRLVAAIIESSHDDRGIIWPESVAPFDLTLLNLHPRDDRCTIAAEKIYETFCGHQEVLYDNRDVSVGEKLADADLMGMPWQIIIGSSNIGDGLVELKNRKTKEIVKMSLENVIGKFMSKCYCPQNC
ncbi:MAG: proline--tRNA ligase [Holosporaceae bacterium]|jgi:prolyl-tRNA synthetase|nr:proline--tRNA ligase [Holosporaceae bacterium]